MKGAAQINSEFLVMVFAGVLQNEVGAAGAAGGVVNKIVNADAAHELGFQKNLRGKLALEAHAPVHEARSEQFGAIDGECGEKRCRHALRVIESVLARPAERGGN